MVKASANTIKEQLQNTRPLYLHMSVSFEERGIKIVVYLRVFDIHNSQLCNAASFFFYISESLGLKLL